MTLEIIIAVAAFGLAAVQFMVDYRARNRQRDAEMTAWGNEVVDLMAQLETLCSPIARDSLVPSDEFEALGEKASALVDRGRFFFPNVNVRKHGANDEGTRVKVLDEVLRACYVARGCATDASLRTKRQRQQVWAARRRFVRLLQEEMGPSLRKVGQDSEGDHIPRNPLDWPDEKRGLGLPG